MKKFTKSFHGVRDGEIYPTEFSVGDECPPELVAGAESLGAIEDESDDNDTDTGDGDDDDKEAGATAGDEKAALRAQLEAAGIGYAKQWGVAKLRAALAEGQKG